MDTKRELIVGKTTIVMLPDQVLFFPTSHNDNAFATFYIPCQFRDVALEFYDLYIEQDCLTVLLACRRGYDVAIHLSIEAGEMIDWHYTK